jgi:diguanylate cyclase (GGDEF)-like protein
VTDAPGFPAGSVVLGSSLLGRLRAPFDDPSVDLRVRHARLGAAVYALAAAVGAATIPFVPVPVHSGWLWVMVAVAALSAVVEVVLPWERWPDQAILVSTAASLVVFGVGVGGLSQALGYYLPLYALTFTFVGLTQRPGTSLTLAPVALLFGCTELLTGNHGTLAIPLFIMIGASTLIGELIANYVRLQRVAGETLDELLMSVTGLTGCATVEEAAELASAVLARLVGAEIALLVVRESPGSTKFFYAGGLGTAEAEQASERPQRVLDTATTPSGTGIAAMQRRMIFVPDARTSPLVMRSWADESGIASALYLPLVGKPGSVSGVAIAGFLKPRKPIDAITTRALNLLAEATGRVVEQLRQADRLARDADTDQLTGLHNRRVFFRELSELAPGDAVVFLDLDHFKNLNDTRGHVAGDQELAAFGALLREQVRDGDIAARYGGEEFAMIVRGDGRVGATLLTERLRDAWSRSSALTFSVGAALHEVGAQPGSTLAAADRAVYAAKEAGRDRMCWFDEPEAFGATAQVPLARGGSSRHRRDRDDIASA